MKIPSRSMSWRELRDILDCMMPDQLEDPVGFVDLDNDEGMSIVAAMTAREIAHISTMAEDMVGEFGGGHLMLVIPSAKYGEK